MSELSNSLHDSMKALMTVAWDERNSDTIPRTEDVKLSDGAIRVDATYIYADLARSTALQKKYKDTFAARIIRMYLNGASQIIRAHEGHIKSFDGDRVMGVFDGGSRRNNATNAALKINWLVVECINPLVRERLERTKSEQWTVSHGVGVDDGETLIARAGVRNSAGETTHNDLTFVGRAPNIAAKLSSLRDVAYGPTLITAAVFNSLKDAQKYSSKDHVLMWSGPHQLSVGTYALEIYGSTWWRAP